MEKKILSLILVSLILFLCVTYYKTRETFSNSISLPNLKGVSNLFLPNFVFNKNIKNKSNSIPSNIDNSKPRSNSYINNSSSPNSEKLDNKDKNVSYSDSNDIQLKEMNKLKNEKKNNLPYNPGYSFAPPSSWRFDEKRPPKCYNGKCGLNPMPVYDKGLPNNYLDYTGTNSIYPVISKEKKGITLPELFEKELYLKMATQNIDINEMHLESEEIEPMMRDKDNLDFGTKNENLLNEPLINTRLAKMIKGKTPIEEMEYKDFVYSDKSFSDMLNNDPITQLLDSEDQGNEQTINKTEYCNMFCKQNRVCTRACKKYCNNFGVCSNK